MEFNPEKEHILQREGFRKKNATPQCLPAQVLRGESLSARSNGTGIAQLKNIETYKTLARNGPRRKNHGARAKHTITLELTQGRSTYLPGKWICSICQVI